VRPACLGSLKRRGVNKVHWECWDRCNLDCAFCYRTVGEPLRTEDAELLLTAVATAGAETVVLAGGDPSLRRDLGHLVLTGQRLGLRVEIHTNAHHAPPDVRQALAGADWVGLSLDGPTPAVHDRFRSKPGNYARVFDLLGFLDRVGVPVIVRTVVARPNHREVADIGDLLLPYDNVTFWYLLEFSAVGSGFDNQGIYQLEHALYDRAATEIVERYAGQLDVRPRPLEDKAGAYLMVTPDGAVYGTGGHTVDGRFPRVGAVLHDHLGELAGRIEFNREVHEPRYREINEKLQKQREVLAQRPPVVADMSE
jgi:MoaA/NifB/PqqE/SkfB family radical SAM enzyme